MSAKTDKANLDIKDNDDELLRLLRIAADSKKNVSAVEMVARVGSTSIKYRIEF